MNTVRLKKMLIVIAFFALLFIIIILTIQLFTAKKEEEVTQEEQNGVYRFNQLVDIETATPTQNSTIVQDNNKEVVTDFGVLSEYYEDIVTFTDEEGSLYIETDNGYAVYSKQWKSDGLGAYVNQPSFGKLVKFITKEESIEAVYQSVSMKDVTAYINELAGMGYNDILLDNQNKKKDIYDYSVQKDDIVVTLNYQEGAFNLTVRKKF